MAYSLYTSSLITPAATFNDIVFFIVFSLAVIISATYLELKFGIWQTWRNTVLLVPVATVSYFVAESAALVALLFAALVIYLSTTFDMILDASVYKTYNHPYALALQLLAWVRRDESSHTQSSRRLLQQLWQLNMPRPRAQLEVLVDGLRSEKLGGTRGELERNLESIKEANITWYDETHPDRGDAIGKGSAHLVQPLAAVRLSGSLSHVYDSARVGDDHSLVVESRLGSNLIQERISHIVRKLLLQYKKWLAANTVHTDYQSTKFMSIE